MLFRIRKLSAGLVLAYAVALVSHGASAQDFDPSGRHHPHPTGGGGHPTGGGGHPTGGGGGTTVVQSPQVLIDRYTKIVLSQPGSVFPLQRLAQLYREKDGNLKGLIADFEKRAAATGNDQYASVVTLAGIYKIEGRIDDAVKTYEQGIALKPNDPSAILALAHAYQDRGDAINARTRFAQALPLQTVTTDKEQTLRTLMSLALDAKDWAGARGYHEQLVKLEPTSLFVKGELGRELFSRGEYEKSEAEFKELVTAATGDNRALAPALKDLGKAQAKAHKNQDALATLKKALAVAGQEAAVRAEIYETITEIYRADQQLPILIKQIEDEHPGDFARLRLLGSLYEETGDANNAIATYRKALAIQPRDIDLRLKMVRLLQSQGELDKAIAEYEGLIRAAPNNPQFVFEECEALLQRGDRERALRLLTELEARAAGDEESLSRLADFYGRIGEADKSMRVLTRLTQIGSSDPSHLVDLGDHYFQEGNTALAITTWKRILSTITPRSRALAALADVYLEHDMTDDALAAIREAVSLEPQNINFKKQLASALERKQDRAGARQVWQELSEKARQTGDKLLARETRTHIVTLLSIEHLLEGQIPIWQAQFAARQPDIEAGRTLAEAQIHQRKLADAETTLRRVIDLAPGDTDTYLALERVLVQGNKLPDAIAVLEKLLAVDPKLARGIYQRMSTYALQLHRDDDAIKYASRAVELNPDDAEGHRHLGEMYRQRQDTEHAITEFRAAIAKNDRLFVVYFDLADLLLSKGLADEADRLYRRIIRGAPDEEYVAHAARLSKQINLGRGTLESLEQDLLPLAIGNPQRSIYRRTLVEIYGDLTFSLMQRVRHGEGKDADEARAQLAKIGARAVKPLLDALADGDTMQQRIAIDVLSYVQNKNAGPSLFAFATGQAELPLRVRAMIACGALRDPGMLPKFQSLLVPKTGAADEAMPADAVAVAAAWGVARVNDRRAIPMLQTLAKKGTPEMRAVAMLGLAQLKDRSSTAQVAAVAKAPDSGTIARAAAAYALGELGAEGEAPTLLALAQGNDALPRELALVSLARMGANKNGEPPGGKAAIAAMSDAVFAGGETQSARARIAGEAIQRAGTAALTLLASPALAKAQSDSAPRAGRRPRRRGHARSARAAQLERGRARRGAREIRGSDLAGRALGAPDVGRSRADGARLARRRRRQLQAVRLGRHADRRGEGESARDRQEPRGGDRPARAPSKRGDAHGGGGSPRARGQRGRAVGRGGRGRRSRRAGAARGARGHRRARGRRRGRRGEQAPPHARKLGDARPWRAGARPTRRGGLRRGRHEGAPRGRAERRLRARPRGRAPRARELRQDHRDPARVAGRAKRRRAPRPRHREAHRVDALTNPESARPSATRLALALTPGTLLSGVAGGIAFPILPIVGLHVGLSAPFIGLILATNRGVRLVASPFIGALADRIGGRRTLLAGLAVNVVVMCSYAIGLVTGHPGAGFLGGRILHGLGSGGVFVAAQALALLAGGASEGGRAAGTVRASIVLGVPIGLVCGGLLSDAFGPVVTFSVAALAVVCALFGAYVTVPDLRGPSRTARDRASIRESILAMRDPRLSTIGVLNFALNFAAGGMVLTTLAFVVAARHVSLFGRDEQGTAGLLMGWMTLIDAAATPLAGRLGDRHHAHAHVATASLVLLIVGLLLVAPSLGTAGLLVALAFLGLGAAGLGPSLLVLMGAIVPRERRGAAVGVMQLCSDIGGMLGPLVGTALLTGSRAYLAAAALLTLFVPLAVWLARSSGARVNAPDLPRT